MSNVTHISDYLARRRQLANPATPAVDHASSAAGALHNCPRCREAQQRVGACDACLADIERDHLEMRRFQEHRAALRGCCPTCWKPIDATRTLLGIEHGYIAYHPQCVPERRP